MIPPSEEGLSNVTTGSPLSWTSADLDDSSSFASSPDGIVSYGVALHVGSSRPHALDGWQDELPPPAWAHTGSLRLLEPELDSVLLDEPLPVTNSVLVIVEPDAEIPFTDDPPGPFTLDELLPDGVYDRVVDFGIADVRAVARARRGTEGWRVAKNMRPTAFILTEEEALRPAARGGFTYTQHEVDGLWHAVRPSTLADPCESGIDVDHFDELADRTGYTDNQLRGWMRTGFPGAPYMPVFAQMAPKHVGALEHAEIFAELASRDAEAGFVTCGNAFPDTWPCVVDPMNVVVQKGKGRVTIDKTMHVSGDPELPSYNMSIVLVEGGETRYLLVRVWQAGRALMILKQPVRSLASLGVFVLFSKYDIKSFFRVHGKQRAHQYQSGRLTLDGFGTDGRSNFGECDAPDNNGRASNAGNHFVRHELLRLEHEYPPVIPELLAWLDRRRLIRAERAASDAGFDAAAADFVYAVLFFVMMYVDDGFEATIDDPLYRRDGTPLIILITAGDGTVSRVHQRRASLYNEASTGTLEYVGWKCPVSKRCGPDRFLELLGVELDDRDDLEERRLSAEKAKTYHEHAVTTLQSPTVGVSSNRHTSRKSFESLVHRLLHCCEIIHCGRSYLFHLMAVLRAVNRLHRDAVVLSPEAQRELRWWIECLQQPELYTVPMASRFSFLSAGEEGVLTNYGDASREFDEETGEASATSGFGSWYVAASSFFYLHGRWSHDECRRFSINVLELAVENFALLTFVPHARGRGVLVTHVDTFVDNTTAEHVAERGRTQRAPLHELNSQRRAALCELNVFMRSRRVASVFNDVADLLSRGDIEEALRHPRDAGLTCLRVDVDSAARDLSRLSPTWS